MAKKQNIIEVVAHEAGISKACAQDAINAAFDYIKGTVKTGEQVVIRQFGTFKLKQTKARMGRNPRNGAPAIIPAKTVPKISFSKQF